MAASYSAAARPSARQHRCGPLINSASSLPASSSDRSPITPLPKRASSPMCASFSPPHLGQSDHNIFKCTLTTPAPASAPPALAPATRPVARFDLARRGEYAESLDAAAVKLRLEGTAERRGPEAAAATAEIILDVAASVFGAPRAALQPGRGGASRPRDQPSTRPYRQRGGSASTPRRCNGTAPPSRRPSAARSGTCARLQTAGCLTGYATSRSPFGATTAATPAPPTPAAPAAWRRASPTGA
jgi:hypothetical protein